VKRQFVSIQETSDPGMKMRLAPLLAPLALALCLAPCTAQFSLGPNGVSAPPINLVSVYKYLSNLWSGESGRPTSDAGGQMAAERRDVTDADIASLKERIEQASQAAAGGEAKQSDPDVPLTRALLLPKKKFGIGKWPLVYSVLNSLLLAGVIVLAKPYFYEGETVATVYTNSGEYRLHPSDPDYGYGTPNDYGYGYDDGKKGHKKGFKGFMKGYKKGHKDYKKSKGKGKGAQYMYVPKNPYHEDEGYPQYPRPPKYGGHSEEGYGHEGYPIIPASAVHNPSYDQSKPQPTAYAVIPASEMHDSGYQEARPSKSKGSSKAKGYGAPKSHAYAVINAGNADFNTPSPYPGEFKLDISHGRYKKKIESHQYYSRSDEKQAPEQKHEEIPFNERHYYNPTVFRATADSSYACMERMVCLNPSRSARALAISEIADTVGGSADPKDWARMLERLDAAAARGKRHESCEEYYCPPQLPEYFEANPGDDYAPPPAEAASASPEHSDLLRLTPEMLEQLSQSPDLLSQLARSPGFANQFVQAENTGKSITHDGEANISHHTAVELSQVPKSRDSGVQLNRLRKSPLVAKLSPLAVDSQVNTAKPQHPRTLQQIAHPSKERSSVKSFEDGTHRRSVEFVKAPRIKTLKVSERSFDKSPTEQFPSRRSEVKEKSLTRRRLSELIADQRPSDRRH